MTYIDITKNSKNCKREIIRSFNSLRRLLDIREKQLLKDTDTASKRKYDVLDIKLQKMTRYSNILIQTLENKKLNSFETKKKLIEIKNNTKNFNQNILLNKYYVNDTISFKSDMLKNLQKVM